MSDAVHRYTQPPSKVLHVRNLPYETSEAELFDLCAPFGKLVQVKLGVGANKNQAFVEFSDLHSAINMVTFFLNSAEPAKVRGKTVYLQYSTRQEIVNNRGGGEVPSNVLLVTLEGLSPDTPVTIETLHLVFSAFGFVHKIATFEKSAGFQALIKYGDAETAREVRENLDCRHIPRHLIHDAPNPPLLKISYSQHNDLNVKFQSHRSRDYTNPNLPVAPHSNDGGFQGQHGSGHGGSSSNPSEGNVLLCTIENQAYPVTVDALSLVFSPYGMVQKIAIFEKNHLWQALVQYPDKMSAATAKMALEGHAIYDGGYNRLRISYSVHNDLNVKSYNQRSRDFTVPQPGDPGHAPPHNLPTLDTPMYSSPLLHPTDPAAMNPMEDGIVTGIDYERAHEEVARAAKAALAPITALPDTLPPGPGTNSPNLPPPTRHMGPPAPGHPRPLNMGPPSDYINGPPLQGPGPMSRPPFQAQGPITHLPPSGPPAGPMGRGGPPQPGPQLMGGPANGMGGGTGPMGHGPPGRMGHGPPGGHMGHGPRPGPVGHGPPAGMGHGPPGGMGHGHPGGMGHGPLGHGPHSHGGPGPSHNHGHMDHNHGPPPMGLNHGPPPGQHGNGGFGPPGGGHYRPHMQQGPPMREQWS